MLTESFPRSAPAAAALGRGLRGLLIAAPCTLLAACATTYLMQAASGQWHVNRARVPIDTVIADPKTPPQLQARLTRVREAREFASRDLGLPDNQSYRSYADIARPFVVWNVIATPEFSIVPHHWCFPVAGCVAYRGYFHEQAAREFAAAMAQKGYDVTVEGVPAYSTLGRFSDPVLSSMMRYGDDELVAEMFHELAHQLLYVKDDSAFNEAFATTVEDAGLERWLAYQGTPERMREFLQDQQREEALVRLLGAARRRLAALYATQEPAPVMRAHKRGILEGLADDIHALERRERVAYPPYDEWVRTGLNNAHLAAVATYYECVPGFKQLLAQEGNDLARFYAAARALSRRPRAERHARVCGPAAAAADAEAD